MGIAVIFVLIVAMSLLTALIDSPGILYLSANMEIGDAPQPWSFEASAPPSVTDSTGSSSEAVVPPSVTESTGPLPVINSTGNGSSDNSMWVEPSAVSFSATNASVGTRFNVTVWLNMTEDIFAYQVGMLYNCTQLRCTRAGYTGENTSQYFVGHKTNTPSILIDTSFLHDGSILVTESCLGDDKVLGPRIASLIWAEFEILNAPSKGNSTSTIDISTEYPTRTWVFDFNCNRISLTPSDATFTLAP